MKFHLCSSYSSRDIPFEHSAPNRKLTQSLLLLSFFDVPMAPSTSRDGQTVAALDVSALDVSALLWTVDVRRIH